MANCGSRAAWASPSLSTPPARRLSRRLIKRNSTVQGSTSRCLECLWTTHQGCSLLAGAARKPAPTVRVLNIAQLYTDPFPCFCWAIGTREIPGQPHGFSFLLKHRCRHFGGEWLIGLAFYFLHLWQGVAGMLYRGSCRWRRCDAACNDYGSRAKRQVWPRPEAACRIPAEQQLGKENSCCKEERNAEKEKCFSKKDRREKKVRKRDKPFANAENTRCKSPPRHRRWSIAPGASSRRQRRYKIQSPARAFKLKWQQAPKFSLNPMRYPEGMKHWHSRKRIEATFLQPELVLFERCLLSRRLGTHGWRNLIPSTSWHLDKKLAARFVSSRGSHTTRPSPKRFCSWQSQQKGWIWQNPPCQYFSQATLNFQGH